MLSRHKSKHERTYRIYFISLYLNFGTKFGTASSSTLPIVTSAAPASRHAFCHSRSSCCLRESDREGFWGTCAGGSDGEELRLDSTLRGRARGAGRDRLEGGPTRRSGSGLEEARGCGGCLRTSRVQTKGKYIHDPARDQTPYP